MERTAALVVDEQEVDALRIDGRGERTDQRAQQLALARARCAGDEDVWSVVYEIDHQRPVALDADRDDERPCRLRGIPTRADCGLVEAAAQELQQRYVRGERGSRRRSFGVGEARHPGGQSRGCGVADARAANAAHD